LIERRSRQFVARGKDPASRGQRAEIVRAFRRIHRSVVCGHDELELLFIAGFVLDHPGLGPIVECGAFKGGSSAKLSVLAQAVDADLHIFDSFQGVPEPTEGDGTYVTTAGVVNIWRGGAFAGSEAEVRANIRAHGVLERCHFHQGYFEQTRPGSDLKPGYAFIDVDLASSARTCIQFLWPNLTPGGRLFFHDVNQVGFCRGITDADWWRDVLGQPPPVLWGAGYGCGDMAPNLGYFEKP
jgi:hypothetical protein